MLHLDQKNFRDLGCWERVDARWPVFPCEIPTVALFRDQPTVASPRIRAFIGIGTIAFFNNAFEIEMEKEDTVSTPIHRRAA
jgi:hypothetical protein